MQGGFGADVLHGDGGNDTLTGDPVDIAVAEAGIPTLGYFAQVPHYVNGEYPAAAVALLECPAAEGVFFNGGYAFESAGGDPLAALGGQAVFDDGVLYVEPVRGSSVDGPWPEGFDGAIDVRQGAQRRPRSVRRDEREGAA